MIEPMIDDDMELEYEDLDGIGTIKVNLAKKCMKNILRELSMSKN